MASADDSTLHLVLKEMQQFHRFSAARFEWTQTETARLVKDWKTFNAQYQDWLKRLTSLLSKLRDKGQVQIADKLTA